MKRNSAITAMVSVPSGVWNTLSKAPTASFSGQIYTTSWNLILKQSMMECPVQCGCNAHAAPGFFLWQELPLKHPKRMRSPMPQAAFYGDWGISPTSRKSLSCHESPACRRVDSKKIVQNLEELSIDFVRFLE